MSAAQSARAGRHADDDGGMTDCQRTARVEILKAFKPRGRHLLTGPAGTGKTWLMGRFARDIQEKRKKVTLTAPTHKAVAVLARKMAEAGLTDIECQTIHSLLSLEPKPGDDGRLVLRRRKYAEVVKADAVVLDECSMEGTDLFEHVERNLSHCFVLRVGDEYQLNPVNEDASPSFSIPSRSNLVSIRRQDADNPLLLATSALRDLQSREDMDWSWCRSAKLPPKGVYLPGGGLDLWMQRAFLSSDFKADPDAFRYLCWTNERVAQINAKVRNWLYGETVAPFVPGEVALVRAPIFQDDAIVFNTNEEVPVEAIEPGSYRHIFKKRGGLKGWSVEIPSWQVTLQKPDGPKVVVHMPRDERLVSEVNDRLVSEARSDHARWEDFYGFKNKMARLQAIYALTVHNSQGSTLGSVFVDVPDIRRRERSNLLEMKRLFYVAASRPTTSPFLAGR
jgi:exodeoxyribonuclease-5